MDTEQTVEQKRAIWQRVNPTLQPYPAEADAVNVCCMGVNAREDVEVIQGFIEEELADRRSYLACAGMAPNAAARQVMRRLAAEEGGHARKLMGVYYLVTGQVYCPAVSGGCEKCPGSWRELLRLRYIEGLREDAVLRALYIGRTTYYTKELEVLSTVGIYAAQAGLLREE